MKPIFITVGNELPLMIIPDSQAHLDGHTILTYTYNIYKNVKSGDTAAIKNKESFLHLEKNKDPNYMGYFTFEQANKQFSYIPAGDDMLTGDEVDEIIELINHYRDTPKLWSI